MVMQLSALPIWRVQILFQGRSLDLSKQTGRLVILAEADPSDLIRCLLVHGCPILDSDIDLVGQNHQTKDLPQKNVLF